MQSLVKWILLSIAICPIWAGAQPVEHNSDYFSTIWTTNDGLPHNSINAISQTTDGYLWFATWEGVARFNGQRFQLFNRTPQTGMADSGSKALFADGNNHLWVGGARGSLTERLGDDWRAQPKAPSLISHVFLDRAKNMWLAIAGAGVQFRPYLSSGNYGAPVTLISDVSGFRIAQTPDGTVYAATSSGLYSIVKGNATLLTTEHFRRAEYISLTSDNQLLVATDNGAWLWDGKSFAEVTPELRNVSLSLVEMDNDGVLWFGTVNQGLARLVSGQSLSYFEHNEKLAKRRILSWFQDNEGNIWVGTNSGVIKLHRAAFISLNQEQGIIGSYIRTVLAINEQEVLVGSSSGLSLLKGRIATNAVLDGDFSHLSVLSLEKSHDGGVWVGTYQQGLLYWKDGKLTRFMNADSGLPVNEVRAIEEDRKGNLWIGTANGLVKRSAEGQITLLTHERDRVPDDFIVALAEDKQGKIWIGTGLGGAYFEQGQLHQLNLKPLDEANYIFGFYIESGYVWMATDRGLIRFRQSDHQLSNVGRSNGLPIDKFFQVKRIGNQVWLSSNIGVWLLDYRQMMAVADGSQSSIEYEHFDSANGMGSTQVNGGSNPAATVSGEQVYFATANGVSSTSTTLLQQSVSDKPLAAVIESVQFDSEIINKDINHTAPAGTNRISFYYIGLSFSRSESLQYQTKLEGYEQEWIARGNDTVTEYTNLAPGHYRFLVKSRYPYREWSSHTAVYEFEIEPLFWQRTSVIIASALLTILLLVMAIQWRIRDLKQNSLHLKLMVEEKTTELKQQKEEFERLAKEDPLTGLANRRAFNSALEQQFLHAIASQQHFHLAIIDIDKFKRINDLYNHLCGDKVISKIAAIFKSRAQSEFSVARWGGEEFAILYSGNNADEYFESIRQAVESADFADIAPGLVVTISIGIANSDTAYDYSELLIQADEALLSAKNSGRNCVIHAKHAN